MAKKTLRQDLGRLGINLCLQYLKLYNQEQELIPRLNENPRQLFKRPKSNEK